MLRPSTARAASPRPSDRVGCGWTAVPSSQAVASKSIAALASAMRSVTWGPIVVHAGDLVRLAVRDDLREPLRIAPDERLADRRIGHLADLRGDPLALALLLAAADGRDLGPAVCRAGHLEVVDPFGLGAGDGMHGGDALVCRHVSQPQPADDVADGVEVRLGGAHAVVHLHDALLELGARVLEAHPVRVRGAARGHQHLVGAELLGLLALSADHDTDPALVDDHGGGVEPRARHDRDTSLRE